MSRTSITIIETLLSSLLYYNYQVMSQTITNTNGELDKQPPELPLPSQETTDPPATQEAGPCLGSPNVAASLASYVSLPLDQQSNNPQEAPCQFTPLDQLSTSKKEPALEVESGEGTLKIGMGQDHEKNHDWLLQFIKKTSLPSRVVARVLKLTKDYDQAYKPLQPTELHKLKCIYFVNILVAVFETKELSEEELKQGKEIEVFKMEEQELVSMAINHTQAFFENFNQSSGNQEMWTMVAACFKEETSSSIRKAILLSPDYGYNLITLKTPNQSQQETASTPCQEAKKGDLEDSENNPDCNNLSTLTQGHVTDLDISLSLCNNESVDDISSIRQETDKHVDEAETVGAFECA